MATTSYPMHARRNDRRLQRDRGFIRRLASAPLRALPDFLIVGTMKSGTSSLFRYLVQHPDIAPPLRKEIHYFSHGAPRGKGVQWYRAHFPMRHRLRGGQITGEATPNYSFQPGALELAHRLLGDIRVIMLLRNPVERAISHYYHQVRMGRERLPLDLALEVEEERLASADLATEAGRELYANASYKARGIYVEQLSRIYQVFGRENCLVLQSEAMFADPITHVNRTLGFLGVAPCPAEMDLSPQNVGANRKGAPREVTEQLARYFAPHNERLYELLGQRLNW